MTPEDRGRVGWLGAIASCALVLGVLAGLVAFPSAPERLFGSGASVTEGRATVGGPFSLIDHNGRRVSDTDFRGRYMLVMFGYAGSPDVTPAQLQMIAAALNRLGEKADRLATLFITLDPERDRPEVLASYLGNYHPLMLGLTGSPEKIAAVARSYRVPMVRTVDPKTPAGYVIHHDSLIYLMNPEGVYVANLSQDAGLDVLISLLAKVL